MLKRRERADSDPAGGAAGGAAETHVGAVYRRLRERPRPVLSLALLFAFFMVLVLSKYKRTSIDLAGEVYVEDVPKYGVAKLCAANGWKPRGRRAKVYSMTAFRSELDMLELRLNELDGVVDQHLVMESTITHSGKPKELVFMQHKNEERFARFGAKVVHVVENNTRDQHGEAFDDAHERERSQRSALVRALDGVGAADDDLVVFSDLDEIPRADYLSLLAHCEGYGFPVTVHTPEYMYDLGCRIHGDSWTRLKVVQRKHLTADCGWSFNKACPHDLRDDQAMRLGLTQVYPPPLVIHEGGWHLTWFMDIEAMIDKLSAYSHPERNTERNRNPKYLECLRKKCIHVNQKDRGSRRDPFTSSDVLPRYLERLRDNGTLPDKWKFVFARPSDLPEPEVPC